MMFDKIHCREASSADDRQACLAIRKTVFIEEQNVPTDLELDGLDDDCLHYLAEVDGVPIATARVQLIDDKYKFQRVAVLQTGRGMGIGAKIMAFMMDDLRKRADSAGKSFFLSSQVGAIGFYQRLGFMVCSEPYFEAGIEHRDMRMAV